MRTCSRLSCVPQGAVLGIPSSEVLLHRKFKHPCAETDATFQTSCKTNSPIIRTVLAPSVRVRLQPCPCFNLNAPGTKQESSPRFQLDAVFWLFSDTSWVFACYYITALFHVRTAGVQCHWQETPISSSKHHFGRKCVLEVISTEVLQRNKTFTLEHPHLLLKAVTVSSFHKFVPSNFWVWNLKKQRNSKWHVIGLS